MQTLARLPGTLLSLTRLLANPTGGSNYAPTGVNQSRWAVGAPAFLWRFVLLSQA